MRRATFLPLVVLFALTTTGKAAETFTVGVENTEYLPYYAYRDGEYRGFAADVLNMFARDRGYVFEFRPFPVIRLFNEFAAGNLDFKYPDNAYWAAEARKNLTITYSGPVAPFTDGVSVTPVRKGLGADALKVLGTVRGFTPSAWADRLKDGRTSLAENNSFLGLIDQGLYGRVDGVYADVAVVKFQLASIHRPTGLVYDPDLPHTKSEYHLSTIRHPDVLKVFDAWMAENGALLARMRADQGIGDGEP